MYISVLDYRQGRVVIHEVHNSVDAEDYVSDHFGLDNVEWMVTEDLILDVSNKRYEEKWNNQQY